MPEKELTPAELKKTLSVLMQAVGECIMKTEALRSVLDPETMAKCDQYSSGSTEEIEPALPAKG
jgi:hypothetical protein